jgi:hypothetical protein
MKKEIYTRSNGSIGVRYSSTQPSSTNVNFQDEVDVNNIIDRFLSTGQLTHVSSQPMEYVDHTNAPTDLLSAKSFIQQQTEIYSSLNKKTKNKFPTLESFLEFAENPENQEELKTILGTKKTTIQTTINDPVQVAPSSTPTPNN